MENTSSSRFGPLLIPGLVIVSLAQVVPATAAGSEWQHVAFAGCGARTVIFHPVSADTCYAGSAHCGAASEGVHRSDSGGRFWVDLGMAEYTAKSIAVNPRNTQQMYAACPSAVYRTEDGGDTWLLSMDGIELVSDAEFMTVVAVNPAFPETLFAGVRSAFGWHRIYRSFDHAQTWHELYLPPLGWSTRPYDIAIDPKITSTVCAALESHVVISHSSGDAGSWFSVMEADSATFWDIAFDPLFTDYLYVAAVGEPSHGGVYRSTNGGEDWELLGPDQGLASCQVTTVAVDPVNPSCLYAGTRNEAVEVFRSTDRGDSWSPMDSGLPEACKVNGLAVDPETGSVILAAIAQDGLYRFDFTTSIAGERTSRSSCNLGQNHPNPFHPSTTVRFSLGTESAVRLDVYNCQGQRVRNLIDRVLPAGEHRTLWDGQDENGQVVASGVYFYRLEAADFSEMKKMVLLE